MFREEFGNGGEGLHKYLGHLIPLEITGSEDESTDSRTHQRSAFEISVPDTVVFGENDPAVLSRVS